MLISGASPDVTTPPFTLALLIMVVIGGVIPPGDVAELERMGAAAVFLPGTVIARSALDLLARLREQLDR